MSNQVLKSFDPFATHPFTNSAGVTPQPNLPSHPTYHLTRPVNSSRSNDSSSHPSSAYSPPAQGGSIRAPQPVPAGQQPIFTPFRPDRVTPDLPDVLAKKSGTTQQWADSRKKTGGR
ncbi:hypothetical protein SISNIDRAFT_447831 [Sistotremastrum niveocremeum HHB9708]|uniref:Uncharacterized protein n=2 Tax=Sistotremastraceae TaxID=3402574 RepID=A0A165AHI8_9AGAM|nr:hypothetical protein SISNIDRAFT_447831 [Sistotremastrum niveocremeum HHB9708]KZT44113.1 hypothetical protein SISSUDRAFT_1039394 [Sistotremastrum suecicum HHB10207 ss-3]